MVARSKVPEEQLRWLSGSAFYRDQSRVPKDLVLQMAVRPFDTARRNYASAFSYCTQAGGICYLDIGNALRRLPVDNKKYLG